MGITNDEICNNVLFHTKLARPRSINVRNSMIYLDMLYVYLLLRKHVKCVPPADRLDCRISIKMGSQPCGGTIANTVRVFTAMLHIVHVRFVTDLSRDTSAQCFHYSARLL